MFIFVKHSMICDSFTNILALIFVKTLIHLVDYDSE